MLISKPLNLHEVYLTLSLIRNSECSYWSGCTVSHSSFPNHYRQFQWNLAESSYYWCNSIFKCHICVKLFTPEIPCNSQFRGKIFLSIKQKWLSSIVYDSCILHCYSYNRCISTHTPHSVIVIKIRVCYLKVKRSGDWTPCLPHMNPQLKNNSFHLFKIPTHILSI